MSIDNNKEAWECCVRMLQSRENRDRSVYNYGYKDGFKDGIETATKEIVEKIVSDRCDEDQTSGDMISRAELFNKLAVINAPMEANEYKAEVYKIINEL